MHERTTMYIKNKRDNSKFKVCSPRLNDSVGQALQLYSNLTGK